MSVAVSSKADKNLEPKRQFHTTTMPSVTLDDLFQSRAGRCLSRVSVADPHVAVQPSLASRAMKVLSETTEEMWSSGPENEVSDSSYWKFLSRDSVAAPH